MAEPTFDLQSAHKYFSTTCFNRTWEFIEKQQRTEEDNQTMILLSMASLWHWTQRPDCAPNNLFGGYWQISRVYAIIGNAEQARIYGQLALKHGTEAGPFHEGYGHEALAHAEMVAGNKEQMRQHLEKARKLAETVTNAEEKKYLLADLDSMS